ncbi:leukocyte elastase inhibitor A-like [Paramacrobiotus metropolitanus]|uniref:leukocyte elastase inhibitor A-like n=1 Tax=Paramacrobiotus metropolitanus TaxID=2943436 RepID=UPI0024462CFB|nr:leukocyte elastase inhibitor A-like [Paramacrobiotus metropolitanus]XP_055342584.1 leukocyte elastase inhibitor A-like [Paramacrobiotus metropolitanus]
MPSLLELFKQCLGRRPPPVPRPRPQPRGYPPPPHTTDFSVNSDNSFAVALFKKLVETSYSPHRNIAVSPQAAQVVFAILLPGTNGEVYSALANLLCLNGRSFADLIESFDEVNANGALNSVSTVFYDDNCRLVSEYRDIVEKSTLNHTRETLIYLDSNEDYRYSAAQPHYTQYKSLQSKFIPAPFRDAFEKAVDTLEESGFGRSGSKFHHWLDERRPDATLVLLNRVEFSGQWEEPFHPENSESGTFCCADGSEKTVVFMTQTFSPSRCYNVTPYYNRPVHDEDPQLLILDVVGRHFTVMIVLPGESNGGIVALEKTLTIENLLDWRQKSRSCTVSLYIVLPRFRIRYGADLKICTQSMRLQELYAASSNGFSRMLSSDGPVKVDEFKQEVTIELDEYGIKSAPCTGYQAELTMISSPNFVANRPFLAVIWNELANVPVCMGRIADPSA